MAKRGNWWPNGGRRFCDARHLTADATTFIDSSTVQDLISNERRTLSPAQCPQQWPRPWWSSAPPPRPPQCLHWKGTAWPSQACKETWGNWSCAGITTACYKQEAHETNCGPRISLDGLTILVAQQAWDHELGTIAERIDRTVLDHNTFIIGQQGLQGWMETASAW